MTILLCLFSALSAMADGEIYYGIYKGTGTLTTFGTKKAETYDVALRLTDPTLEGLEVRGIRIPVNTNAKNVTDYKVWLTHELTLESGKMVPDIVSVDVTPDGKWAEARLAEPYVIGKEGVYAGYSFKVSSLDASDDADPNRTPLMTVNEENPEGLLLHTNRTYRKWTPLAGSGSPALVVLIGGERIKPHAATLEAPANLYTLFGKTISATLTLVNHGTEDIKTIDYEIEMGGKTETKHISKSLQGGYYGRSTTFNVTIPAADEPGTYLTKFRVSKVNDEPNEDPQTEVTTPVVYLKEVPLHKPLVEEYTGTWCQYCPRALAGMEKMADKNGDNFVGVAYHVLDEMEFVSSIYHPAQPSGLPSVFIDRVKDFAPLTGQSEWEARANIIAPANISVVGEWADEAKTKIRATSTATFIRDFKDNPYRVGYILIANDLHSTAWSQQNALSGSATTGDAYLDKYIKAGNPIRDLHYNEVALAQSAENGAGLPESLPADVLGDVAYEHTFEFDITGNELPLVKDKMEVVVVLIDTRTGEAVNCNKGHVVDPTGIDEISGNAESEKEGAVYDLSGRRVSAPTKGLYIQHGKKIIK